MEHKFQLLSIKPSMKDKTVQLIFSLDIDEDSVVDNIYLMQEKPRTHIPCDITVKKRTVTLTLTQWPTPNVTYSLIIEPGKVLSITEEKLIDFLPVKVEFKSEILTDVKILSPKNFEEVKDELTITWQEVGPSPTRKYYIEIATENIFENLVEVAVVDKTIHPDADNKYSATFKALKKEGQYYVRVRPQNDNTYGRWSETITFVLPKTKTIVPNPQPEEKEKPKRPEILDLTKKADPPQKAPEEKPSIVKTPKMVIYDENTPKEFKIEFAEEVQIKEETTKVRIERSVF